MSEAKALYGFALQTESGSPAEGNRGRLALTTAAKATRPKVVVFMVVGNYEVLMSVRVQNTCDRNYEKNGKKVE